MFIKYISKQGNFEELETTTDKNWETKLHKIGNVWFENRETLVPTVDKKAKKEVVIENEVEVSKEEIIEQLDEEIEVKMKEFLKEKKIRGYGLLKGEGLKKRAIEEGFIIN